MFNRLAFASSLAVLTATLYVLFGILALVSPRAFQLLFNAQFFGADVAALLPKVRPSVVSLPAFILVVGMRGHGCTIASRGCPDCGTTRTWANVSAEVKPSRTVSIDWRRMPMDTVWGKVPGKWRRHCLAV